jgi:hypothetical protein
MTGFDKTPWRAARSGRYWGIIYGAEGVVACGLEEVVARYLTNMHNASLLKPTIERKTLDDSCSHPMDNRSADGLRCLSCGILV